jgi:uncharacterized membrane protein
MVQKSKSFSDPLTLGWIKQTSAAQRLAFAGGVGLPCALALMIWRPVAEAALIGWCLMVTINLLLAWRCIAQANPQETQTSVARFDQSSAATLATVIVSVVISMVAIGLLLVTSKASPLPVRIFHVALAVASIALSWLLMHAKFGFHYAHCYYRKYAKEGDEPVFDFPGTREPDYLDFMYFSFVIGMTSQVSDVTINARTMRRLVLVHSLISFAFNLLIVAFFINVLGAIL